MVHGEFREQVRGELAHGELHESVHGEMVHGVVHAVVYSVVREVVHGEAQGMVQMVQNEALGHAVAQYEVYGAQEVVAQDHGALMVYRAARDVEEGEEHERDLSPEGAQ